MNLPGVAVTIALVALAILTFPAGPLVMLLFYIAGKKGLKP